MNTQARLIPALPLLALPLLVAFANYGDDVSFGPEDGSSLSKELELDVKLFLEDLSLNVDGQELPSEMIMGDMDEGIVLNAVIGVTDEFVKSAGGKHVELLRTFDSLSLEGGPESETETMDEFGEYEDSTVRFKWNEEDGEYEVSFADDDGDADVLANLDVDMDFVALLPDGEVATGDTWEVSGSDLGTVFVPGGMVPLDFGEDESEMGDMIQDSLEQQLEEAFSEFRVRCEYGGEREEEGKKLGVITMKFEGEVSIDLSDIISEVIDSLSGEQGVDVSADIIASLDLSIDGEGTMVWDIAGHHVHSFEMTSDMTLLADVEADVEAEGEAHSAEASIEISGDASWSLTTSN